MNRLIILAGLTILLLSGAESPGQESSTKITPLFDLRVRQEVLDGVLFFTPDQDRQWLRFRTRAGLKIDSDEYSFTFRLANEHRRLQIPDTEFDWDELIIDQAFFTWKPNGNTRLTFGRQNIIWDDGFLVLEGHPLDGSRSIYMDGIRVQTPINCEMLDAFLVRNRKYDPVVLAGDEDGALADTDEIGIGAKITLGQHRLAAIWKRDDDPDNVLPVVNTYTLDGRFFWGLKDATSYTFEAAVQYQNGIADGTAASAPSHGFNLAMEGLVNGHFYGPANADFGFFYYGNNFRTPWGRWPKWSELYIYTLLADGGDGRVHVAAWENIAAPRLNLHFSICKSVRARWGLAYLFALEPEWDGRGLLMQSDVKFNLTKGLDGQLLWEMFDAGNYHHQRGVSPVHFLRWQIVYQF